MKGMRVKNARSWQICCTTRQVNCTTLKAADLLGFGTVGQLVHPKTRFLLYKFFEF
jgi:hypothetical protein